MKQSKKKMNFFLFVAKESKKVCFTYSCCIAALLITAVAAASILLMIYRAFIVIKPCKHTSMDIIDEKAKIKIDSNILNRLQKAIRYQTVSYNFFDQNLKEIQEFNHFIRNGIYF